MDEYDLEESFLLGRDCVSDGAGDSIVVVVVIVVVVDDDDNMS